jgi:2-oxoisovalerate dehydrogenase E1 component alpha subunit
MLEPQGRSNRPALELHVPEPEARPGDEIDFSHIAIPPAWRDVRAPTSTSIPPTSATMLTA